MMKRICFNFIDKFGDFRGKTPGCLQEPDDDWAKGVFWILNLNRLLRFVINRSDDPNFLEEAERVDGSEHILCYLDPEYVQRVYGAVGRRGDKWD